MTKSVTCPEELGGLASQVTVDYGQLAHQGRLAAATAEPEEVRRHLSVMEDVMGGGELCAAMNDLTHPTAYHVATLSLRCQSEISAYACVIAPKNGLKWIHSQTDQSRSFADV